MKKICFATDYSYGAHPEVLQAIIDINAEATPGYGEDQYCQQAREKIRNACNAPDAEVRFMVGGTQTNATVIDALLRPTEGVIAADSAHINVHESGAIEASGHKVLALPQCQGKINAVDLERYLHDFYADDTWQHMVEPGMVYITFPTEYGTIYTKDELEAIGAVCRKYGKPLYIDGARLGFGLAASKDLNLEDLLSLCDVFYIGGTKQGALMGEAVVARKGLLHNFMSLTKQHGGLLAKGRLIGAQFDRLFTNDLYMRISRRAVDLACQLRQCFESKGYDAVIDSPTNQQFFRLPNDVIDRLAQDVDFELWGPRGAQSSMVRFVTGWATTEADIENLNNKL